MALSPAKRAPPRRAGAPTGEACVGWRTRRTARGARIEQHGVLLSEVAARPGPTHTLFDVLAAALHAFAPQGPPLLLGFAGGSVVAPLRALGVEGRLEAVDLSRAGEPLFRRVCGRWAGAVRLHEAEASAFLARSPTRYHAILEDLSVPRAGDLEKPAVSFGALPALLARRLKPEGVAVVNLLPTPGVTWARALHAVGAPFAGAVEVRLHEYVNRIVIAGQHPLPARAVGVRLRAALRRLGSRQAGRLSVRALKPAPGPG